jgi:hypothetical protein
MAINMADTVQSAIMRLFAFIFTAFPGLVLHRRRFPDAEMIPYYISAKTKNQTGFAKKGQVVASWWSRSKAAENDSPQKNMNFFLSALDFLHECAILLYELNNLKAPLWRY